MPDRQRHIRSLGDRLRFPVVQGFHLRETIRVLFDEVRKLPKEITALRPGAVLPFLLEGGPRCRNRFVHVRWTCRCIVASNSSVAGFNVLKVLEESAEFTNSLLMKCCV